MPPPQLINKINKLEKKWNQTSQRSLWIGNLIAHNGDLVSINFYTLEWGLGLLDNSVP
jgi:hypothetical protein